VLHDEQKTKSRPPRRSSKGSRSPARQLTELRDALRVADRGDFSVRLLLDSTSGVGTELAQAFNSVMARNQALAQEMKRLARVVGREGRMAERASLGEVTGDWETALDSINTLVGDLVQPTTEVARVLLAVAEGDLTQKMALEIEGQPVKGEFLRIGTTVNTMVDQLRSFAAEVTRVAREVGSEGKLGAQADVKGVSGTWKDLTDNVNVLANNLTDQVRNIAKVTTAVANGDLSQKISVDAKGKILELKNTINTMVDQLRAFASEVTRVAKEVGTEGKLGGQAEVKDVSGVWKDLTDNVNVLAGNLTDQVRNIAKVTTGIANGDLSKKISVDAKGEILELKDTINTLVDQLNSFASEVTRVAKEVGTEGRLGGQADVRGVAGVWKELTDNVNFMASNLTTQVRGIIRVVTAVANGDLSKKFVIEAKGEIAALADTINAMTDTLSTFADQVSTVAREVGVEGKLGGQARVPGVAGTWRDLTDNVNFMASNLTTQVRGIARVVTAVANGNLSQKLAVAAQGEVAALAETINAMTDTLGTFADQVSTVAREVGIEGKLGGQAKVPGAMGTWRQMTDNVNQLAGNLTTQIRTISEIATAVTKGDLTRSITVDAEGEVAALKDNINQMIINLRETTQKNTEQDWLKTNLARFGAMMQGQKSLDSVSRLIMSELTPLVSAHHGAFYLNDKQGTEPSLKLTASYAYRERKSVANRFRPGEGLVGQCALEKKTILLTRVPPDYISINSGLGEAPPLNIIVLPVLFEGQIKAVIELASFSPFSTIHQLFLDQLMESIGVVLNMITANTRTEELLQQSQSLTQELQSQSRELTAQQSELRRSNSELEAQALELEDKARLLELQNAKVEEKNREVELARVSLEEKAEQLALSSKYKSEFVANVSHELRTPLNSLLILAKLLAENRDKNLSEKQVEYARTICASGGDLLTLINEVLDLSKVEAGKMQVEPTDVPIAEVVSFVERSFRPVADEKKLEFVTEVAPDTPASLRTDAQRLQQVIKNLLSNAFKFTSQGRVALSIERASTENVVFENEVLRRTPSVVAFHVSDTGIGIPKNKQRIIFEAFQQADGTTSRKYGGTGLGLNISLGISKLLGGEIRVSSEPGKGSIFSLYLPERLSDLDVPVDTEEAEKPPLSPALFETFEPESIRPQLKVAEPPHAISIEDDRSEIRPGDRVLLIIEDDETFARLVRDLSREKGFKTVVALRGEQGVKLAEELKPDAISLDLKLPGVDGWQVLERLKRNPLTRHIPVQIISAVDERRRGLSMGALSFIEKPVAREELDHALQHLFAFLDRAVRRLLVVEDDPHQTKSIASLLGDGGDVQVSTVSTAEEALERLDRERFDCAVIDLVLPGEDGFKLVEQVKSQSRFRDLPIVIYTGKDLTRAEERQLKRYATRIIVKGEALSPDRLLYETSLFLHRTVSRLPEHTRAAMGEPLRPSLQGRQVLVVDDDVRNIFAMTSTLESYGMQVLHAENGLASVDVLVSHPDVDAVLMDVMMPGMDGYQTIREIRRRPEFASLPIIAITAKALKHDRARCLEAGASDYLSKPIDLEILLETLSRWIGRS
jgi:CheY-like chemotaxis protein